MLYVDYIAISKSSIKSIHMKWRDQSVVGGQGSQGDKSFC